MLQCLFKRSPESKGVDVEGLRVSKLLACSKVVE